jgi:hypothetical protein
VADKEREEKRREEKKRENRSSIPINQYTD